MYTASRFPALGLSGARPQGMWVPRVLVAFAAGTLVMLATPATADWSPGDGHKMHEPQLPDEDGWDVNATFPACLADDWQCSASGVVDEIHFWGSWKHGDVGQVSFNIEILEDLPVGHPQNPYTYSIPGDVLWSWDGTGDLVTVTINPPTPEGWYDPATGEVLEDDHIEYFQHNLTNIGDPFLQDQGTIYWLKICADVVGSVTQQWGWKSSTVHFNDDAVWISQPPDDFWHEMYEPEIVLPPINNNFSIALDEMGMILFGGGGGDSQPYGQGWYYYPMENWWNIWFYDHPFDDQRFKTIDVWFEVMKLNPTAPSWFEFAVNWSTDLWWMDGPGDRPPLPGEDEMLYIGREILIGGPDVQGFFQFPYEILAYNPEWVSIDVRGENFMIEFGEILHDCVGGAPQSLDLAFVINGGEQRGACCCTDGMCLDNLTEAECLDTATCTWVGPGSTCQLFTSACCFTDGSCLNADPTCCVPLGGSASPTGAGVCETDVSGNNVDDACEYLDNVVCEPQPPNHPSNYWYTVTPDTFGRCDFHVRVYDPDPANYTSWSINPNPNVVGDTWQFLVHQVGADWWASWWDSDAGCTNAFFGPTTFSFTNDNPSTWGGWTTTISNSSDPNNGVVDSWQNHPGQPDGLGYRVHVPEEQPCPPQGVICEPQPPDHPTQYWYEVSYAGFCDFHVRVYDPDPCNYSNWVAPANWVTDVHYVEAYGEWWASFWDPTDGCKNAVQDCFTFGFDNANASVWGDWAISVGNSPDPHDPRPWAIVDTSTNHSGDPDGEGYRVHVPFGSASQPKWVQAPDMSVLGMDVSASRHPMFEHYWLADDYECTATGEVTEIVIYGSWRFDVYPVGIFPPGSPGSSAFDLAIHADLPADQSPTGYSMPGAVLWSNTYMPLDFEPDAFQVELCADGLEEGWYEPTYPDSGLMFPGDSVCWKYTFPVGFTQQGTPGQPITYWVSLQAAPMPLGMEPAVFGWKSSIDHWNDDAVYSWRTPFDSPHFDWFEIVYPPTHPLYPLPNGHPYAGDSVDLAFAIMAAEPACITAADCADLVDNATGGPPPDGITDDVCIWWECLAGSCLATDLAYPSDMGGPLGACPPDTFCSLADALHALTCFAGTNSCDPINTDAGGPLGDCAPDGFCNLADALHALTCFAGNNTCSCGPSPEFPSEPNVVGKTRLNAVADRRTIMPGGEVQVRVFMSEAQPDFRAYQLHTATSGGRAGSLDLVNITIEDREDSALAGAADAFEAFNVANGQMLSGLFTGKVATKRMRYLATFNYRASPDAVGTFVVDFAHDEANGGQTFLVGAEQTDKIEIVHTSPAAITVARDCATETR